MKAQLAKRPALVVAALALAISSASAHGPQQVEISDLSFNPAEITMHVGDTVTWVNKDPFDHTATNKGTAGGGPWEIMVPAGKTSEFQPTGPGTVDYFCRFHPNMKCRIIVLSK